MTWIRFSQWAIRSVLIASFFGIVVMILHPHLDTIARFNGIGVAFQIAGFALAIPELAHRLSNKTGTDLIIWANTFMPLWEILNKIRAAKTLGQLSIVLSITGVVLIFIGLGLQYLSSYFY